MLNEYIVIGYIKSDSIPNKDNLETTIGKLT
jgi:hypothetical protein